MAPSTTATASKAGRKKKVTGAEPTRRSTRTRTPREIFTAGVSKAKAPAKPKKKPAAVKEKVVEEVKKVKTAAAPKKPAAKAAAPKKPKTEKTAAPKKAKAPKAPKVTKATKAEK
ncbi:hypothetical protein ABW19_dt0205710 [Dactylella cylindrospora]|nr:hypothetical protein ABW19_dt0205710 [Dactylella cylindrospora]